MARTCGKFDTLHATRSDESELAEDAPVEATAEALGPARRMVWVAVRYYAAYRDEVDERIAANREAADEAEAAWLAERELLEPGVVLRDHGAAP